MKKKKQHKKTTKIKGEEDKRKSILNQVDASLEFRVKS
jgi:hypothetical protein